MLHKKAADVVAAVALALVVLTLGVRANDARAETAELTDAQMDKITAGAWTRGAGFDLVELVRHLLQIRFYWAGYGLLS